MAQQYSRISEPNDNRRSGDNEPDLPSESLSKVSCSDSSVMCFRMRIFKIL